MPYFFPRVHGDSIRVTPRSRGITGRAVGVPSTQRTRGVFLPFKSPVGSGGNTGTPAIPIPPVPPSAGGPIVIDQSVTSLGLRNLITGGDRFTHIGTYNDFNGFFVDVVYNQTKDRLYVVTNPSL